MENQKLLLLTQESQSTESHRSTRPAWLVPEVKPEVANSPKTDAFHFRRIDLPKIEKQIFGESTTQKSNTMIFGESTT